MFYQTDLAYVHDKDFSEIARKSGDFVVEQLKKRGFNGGLVVDLGCGTGNFEQRVTEQGFEALGIDYSAANIEIARKQAPKASFEVASVFDVALPEAQAFTSIGEVLNYLFDEKSSVEGLEQLFQRVYNQLLPNGIFIFDVLEPAVIGQDLITKAVVEGEDWTIFLTKTGNEARTTLTRDIILFRKVGEWYRKSHEVHHVYLLNKSKVINMLERIGFKVQVLDSYNDFQFREGLFGILAEKC